MYTEYMMGCAYLDTVLVVPQYATDVENSIIKNSRQSFGGGNKNATSL